MASRLSDVCDEDRDRGCSRHLRAYRHAVRNRAVRVPLTLLRLTGPRKTPRICGAVLFNWTWYMGMLRGVDEHELITSLEYQGKGTIQVDGQPCTLTKYRVSTNYQYPGQRVQYTCTRPNGQTVFEHRSGQRPLCLGRGYPGR